MTSAEAALERLSDPEAGVSAHYLVAESGRVWQLVDEDQRAWHAGAGGWGAVRDLNSRSVGIELDNDGAQPFGERLMLALEDLLAGILARHGIAAHRVIGHSDMAVGRKVDPGPRFDWRRLARRGLSIWPEPGEPGDFESDAARFGYVWEAGQQQALLDAVRMRFRPGVAGPLDDDDRAIMAALAARWPADAPESFTAAHSTS